MYGTRKECIYSNRDTSGRKSTEAVSPVHCFPLKKNPIWLNEELEYVQLVHEDSVSIIVASQGIPCSKINTSAIVMYNSIHRFINGDPLSHKYHL